MPLWFLPALLGLFAVISLVAGMWLLLHMRDVTRIFASRREGELVPGPGTKHVSRAAVWTAIGVFNAAWLVCVLIWVFAIGGDANAVVDTST